MVLQRLPTPRDDPPPPRPDHYDHRYVLPEHQQYPLSKYNWHRLDDDLEFLEGPHVYLFRGIPLSTSMTPVAHSCQEHFDADRVIQMMKTSRSQRWPRLKYVLDARPCAGPEFEGATADRGVLCVRGDRTIAACKAFEFERSGRALVDAVLVACDGDAGSSPGDVYTFSREMTPDEIKEAWRLNGEDARNRGTEAHLQMQLAVEARPFRADDPEVVHGLGFFDQIGGEWRAYRSEWEIVYPDADLAGSIDLVVARGGEDTGEPLELAIVDYKRSKDLRSNMRAPRKMSPPLSHLDDCDGASYALQLSGYQYILETVYGFTVVDRVLMSIHPDAPFCTSVPYLRDEVSLLFRERVALVQARATAPLRCPMSGVALHDPVFVAGDLSGAAVDRKWALVHDREVLRDDDETREAVEAHVARVKRPVEPDGSMVSWKSRMPKDGYLRPSIYA